MADESDFETSGQPSLQQLATFLADELFSVARLKRVENAMRNAHADGATISDAARVTAGHDMGATLENTWDFAKDKAERGMGAALGWLVGEILGVEVSASDLFNARRDPEASAVGAAIADVAFKMLRGPDGELQPSDEPAKRLLGTLAHIITHCWAEGIVLEKVEGYTSWSGHIEAITDLAKDLTNTLGLNRAARTAIRPLVRAVISRPLEWKTNKTYRPELLSEALAVRQFLRGKWSRERLDEELARQGWSAERIEAHINAQTKTLSLDEAMTLKRVGSLDDAAVQQLLVDQGYDQVTAAAAVNAHTQTRLESVNQAPLSAVKRAFVNNDISRAELEGYVGAIIDDRLELATWLESVNVEQRLNVRHLSAGEVIECVMLDILPTAFYRDWLRREGYPEDEATALEILLRTKKEGKRAAADHAADVTRERAAAQQAKDAAAAARAAELEQQHALARRGSLADLRRAVVRGIVPVSRLEEIIAPLYDVDTVAIYVDLAESDRVAYVEDQAKRADALKRATARAIDVGALERAVLEKVLSPADYRRRLDQLNFSPADADLLTATLTARLRDQDAARAQHDQAAAAAKVRSIDLGRFEQLVRRGARSLEQYATLLQSLGFDDASRAAMTELLRLHIADDAAAAQLRADAAAKAKPGDVSLDLLRRGVILGVATEDDFQRFLVDHNFTSDAQLLLLAELRDDVAQAEAARTRRQQAERRDGSPAISLDRIARAARLGIVDVDAYQARLVEAGYSDDDIAVEMQLLVTEIADVQATRAKRDALAAQTAARGLSLADVARAVKAGAATIEDYRGRAAALGYSNADAALLVAVLEDEVASLVDAQTRHDQIEAELGRRNLSLAQLEAAVKSGLKTIDDYVGDVEALGYGADDAELLATLLLEKLNAGGGAP